MTSAQTPSPSSTTAPTLPATLRLGPVHVTVRDLDRSVAWYQDSLGLAVHGRDHGTARLGTGREDVVVLHEEPEARLPGREAGLYHYALLYPTREELARAAIRLAATRTAVQGASDHGTHEAIYLADPDGNGLELAADRPRERWPASLGYASGPAPLDLDDLLATVAGEEPTPRVAPGLEVGHLHLHVGDVDEALRFYRDVVGFELMARLPSAAFVSAGGYHHHLGFNAWRGEGVAPAQPGTVGLRHWTIVLDDPQALAALRDRIRAAGIAVEERDGGVLVRDPSSNATLFTLPKPLGL
ncbi:MAG: Glyoxalase/bleomycin resistance protein/dioxygenase [Solirubrobacterales bacterium]|nr:Glyoxalase/bleomycin resistance protein/dioxygenase [Solirubrobacterales bacterium]